MKQERPKDAKTILADSSLMLGPDRGRLASTFRLALVTQKVTRGDGQGRVNFEIASAAARQGWQVTLLTSDVAPDLRDLPNVNWVCIPWNTRYSALVAGFRFAWQSGQWLRRRRADFDVLHVNGFNTLVAGDVSAAHFVHGAWIKSPVHIARLRKGLYGAYQWTYTQVNARLERRAFAQARAVVAVSEHVRQELIGIGVPAERIQVILNGVDLTEFHPDLENQTANQTENRRENRTEDRAGLGLPAGVPLALFVGDIRTPRKNLDTVLKALTRLHDAHLAVVGSLTGSPFPAMAVELGIASRVHFLGYRRDVARLMRAVDCFVFPSRYEACSLVLLEALASGLPVITASTAGGAEIITADCGRVLADPDDVQGLTAALHTLLGGAQLRADMSAAARRIAERYSWEQMAADYLQLYQDLACKR